MKFSDHGIEFNLEVVGRHFSKAMRAAALAVKRFASKFFKSLEVNRRARRAIRIGAFKKGFWHCRRHVERKLKRSELLPVLYRRNPK